MNAKIQTIIKLLENLKRELEQCLKHSGGSPFEGSDPILLGDFIVEAYNDYLERAKLGVQDATIQAMTPLTVADESRRVFENEERKSANPRLLKMREVLFHAKQLLVLLEGYAESQKETANDSLVGVMTLLESLGENSQHTLREIHEDPEGMGETVQRLVEEFNRCLDYAREVRRDDKLMDTLFRPLEPLNAREMDTEEAARASRRKLSDVQVAQSGLSKYLGRTEARER